MEFGVIEIGRDDSGDQSVVLVAGQQRARANSSWRNQRRRQQQTAINILCVGTGEWVTVAGHVT